MSCPMWFESFWNQSELCICTREIPEEVMSAIQKRLAFVLTDLADIVEDLEQLQ